MFIINYHNYTEYSEKEFLWQRAPNFLSMRSALLESEIVIEILAAEKYYRS
jgi:hypothetical protein